MVQRGLDNRDFAITTKGWRILDRNLDKVYTLMLNMLAFSKQREPQLETLFVQKVITDVVDLVRDRPRKQEWPYRSIMTNAHRQSRSIMTAFTRPC